METRGVEATAKWLHANHLHRFYICPECGFVSDEPSALGNHIERHREVLEPVVGKRGKIKSKLCPRGCGRYFTPGRGLVEHVPVCTGEKPIVNGTSYHEKTPSFEQMPVMRLARDLDGDEARKKKKGRLYTPSGPDGAKTRQKMVQRSLPACDIKRGFAINGLERFEDPAFDY